MTPQAASAVSKAHLPEALAHFSALAFLGAKKNYYMFDLLRNIL